MKPLSTKRRVFLFRLSLLVVGLFLILSAGALGVLAYTHQNRFYPGVRVAGIRLGSLTKQAGTDKVEARVKEYAAHPVVVTIPDITKGRQTQTGDYPDLEIKTTTADLGMVFADQQALAAGWAVGHGQNVVQWVKAVLPAFFTEKQVPLGYSVNQTQVRTFINTKVLPQVTAPVPAKIRIDGTQVVIDDQKPGIQVNTDTLAAQIATSLSDATDNDTLYVRAPTTEANSSITRAVLQPLADKISALGDLSLTLTAGSTTYQPKRADLLPWFIVVQQASDQQPSLDIDEKAVGTYLDGLKVDRLDKDASLKSVLAQLTAAMQEQQSATEVRALSARTVALTQKPVQTTTVTAGDFTPNLYPGKYIQVNLSEQKLYQAEGGTLINTYRVSTGKWSTPTPKGTFHIISKSLRAYSATYGLYMPYWMNFTGTPDGQSSDLPIGEYGIHELPEWPNGYKEGEGHLGTPVSHGCIRLGVGDAATVYNWADVGTPIVVR